MGVVLCSQRKTTPTQLLLYYNYYEEAILLQTAHARGMKVFRGRRYLYHIMLLGYLGTKTWKATAVQLSFPSISFGRGYKNM
jgi:hypothetical protein